MKAILFDLDGTLIDTVALYEEASRQALALAGHELTDEQFQIQYSQDARLGSWLDAFSINREFESVIREKRHEVYKALLRERVEWFAEAEEGLTLLQPEFSLGIVTGARREYLEIIETKIKFRHCMRVVLTDEDIGGMRKPHPHGLLMASAALNVQPGECTYVGDQLYDLEAAEAAGMAGYLCSPKSATTFPEKYRRSIVASIVEVAKILKAHGI